MPFRPFISPKSVQIYSLLAILCMSSSVTADENLQSQTFTFASFNPPLLSISTSIRDNRLGCVSVVTNTCTTLLVCANPFQRQERTFDEKPLDVTDATNSIIDFFEFVEVPCKPSAIGSPFRYEQIPTGLPHKLDFVVESHKGGYNFYFHVAGLDHELDDDAGWYTSDVSVSVAIMPVLDPVPPAVVCGVN